MKASLFRTPGRFILKQGDEGVSVAEMCRKTRLATDLLQLEEKVRRPVAAGDEEAEAARGRERAFEEDRRGPNTGPRDVAGCHSAKALSRARKR